MKQKFLLLAALAGGGILGAQAQQLPNGGFENWDDCVVYRGKTVETKFVGTDPVNWNGSNISQKGAQLGNDKDDPNLVTKVAGNGSETAVYLHNCFEGLGKIGSVAPAYVTLGTPWAYAKVVFTSIKESDGGSFGGMNFKFRPDAIKFDYKRAHYENPNDPNANRNDNEAASVVAYLWKGSYTNEQKVGYNGEAETMTDRDRFVLGTMQSTASPDAKLIAEINAKIEGDAADWTSKTIEFTYKDNTTAPEKLNVIFCAGDYFGDQKKLGVGNSLTIDNVEFVYYHALTSFTFNGKTYNFEGSTTNLDLSNEVYDKSKTNWEKKGVGAEVIESYNAQTHVLTLTVRGNDYATNNSSETVYTIQFGKPVSGKLSSLTVNGSQNILQTDKAYYTVRGEYTSNSIQYVAEDGEIATVNTTYNAANRIATIHVNANTKKSYYYVKFAKENVTAFESKLLIGFNALGGLLSAPVQSVELATPEVKEGQKRTTLQLLNFSLGDMHIGDIFVEDATYEEVGNKVIITKSIVGKGLFEIFGDAAVEINPDINSLTLNGVLKNNQLTAAITIDWGGNNIDVRVASLDAASIDATGISGVTFSAVREGLTNPNALIYADAGATNAAANDIVDGTCANLTITERNAFDAPNAFHAPKAFTATQVSYDRAFKFGNNYVSSFVLPFAMDKANVDGKVYKFNAVNGDNVNFTEVTGQLEANVPYLIVANSANPFSTALANGVQIAATPEKMEVTANNAPGFAHIGSYNTTKVTSTAEATYYGYTGGKFVKANTGTLNPFRTLIKATGTTATQFSLKLDGEVTGIIGVNTELGKVDVYNLEGKLVRSQVEAATALQGLEKGVYVINGKKVMK